MFRRTKIIATLGPATDNNMALDNLMRAGVDLVRVNFSHGKRSNHQQRIKAISAISLSSAKSNAASSFSTAGPPP